MSRAKLERRLEVLEVQDRPGHTPSKWSLILNEMSLSAVRAVRDAMEAAQVAAGLPRDAPLQPSPELAAQVRGILQADAADPETLERWLTTLEIQ